MAYDPNRFRGEERIAIMALDMLGRSFDYQVKKITPRLERGGYKYVKRDIGHMKAAFTRIRNEAMKGMDEKMRQHINRQSRDYEIRAVQVSVTKDSESVIMPLEDEWQFVQIVTNRECAICLKDGAECRDCEIRKLLRRYVEEPEAGMLMECGFQGCELSDSKKINKQERL